jgi:hypothetical protein
MNKFIIFAAAAASLAIGAGTAQARDNNVQWSIGIQAPLYPGALSVGVGNAPRWQEPVYLPAPVIVVPRPVYGPPSGYGHAQRDWRDSDRDGVPNWRDRHDNRDWRDRDRDGIPNWRDRQDNRDGRDGDRERRPQGRDWRDSDRDGTPNWRDRRDDRWHGN